VELNRLYGRRDSRQEFLESSHSVWLNTLAYLVLSLRERAVWDNLPATAGSGVAGAVAALDSAQLAGLIWRCGLREDQGV
jgi:hypothetical protein